MAVSAVESATEEPGAGSEAADDAPDAPHAAIDAQSAAALCHRVQPRMIIPMHYRTQANADWPIAPVEDFLSAMDAQDAPRMPLLRVTAKDLSEQPRVAVLTEG